MEFFYQVFTFNSWYSGRAKRNTFLEYIELIIGSLETR